MLMLATGAQPRYFGLEIPLLGSSNVAAGDAAGACVVFAFVDWEPI